MSRTARKNRCYFCTHCSEDSLYRYVLTMKLDGDSLKRLTLFQFNPSSAGSSRSDPTVGKVCNWAKEYGYGCVIFLNLFARRAAKPEDLVGISFNDLVGKDNDRTICRELATAEVIVLGWGRPKGISREFYERRREKFEQLMGDRDFQTVGDLVEGIYPRHGRMWNKDQRSPKPRTWKELSVD